MTLHNLHILIVDPDSKLEQPYVWFEQVVPESSVTHLPTIELALDKLPTVNPDIVCISASFSAAKTVQLLEAIKQATTTHIIPVCFVVNWQQRLSTIPGTTWGNKVGLLHTLSSADEVRSTLERISA